MFMKKKSSLSLITADSDIAECFDSTGIKIHGQDFSVKVKGYGNKIQKFILDGKEYEPFVKWDNKAHKVEIILERL